MEDIIELCKSNPDWTNYTRDELENYLKLAVAEKEIQSSANTNNKIKINAGYGILSQKHCRWKKHVNAEAITSCGQLCVRGVGNYITKKTAGLDYEVKNIYNDTDSVSDGYLSIYNTEYNKLLSDVFYEDVYDKEEYSPGKIIGKCDLEIPTYNPTTRREEKSKIKYFCRHLVKKRMFAITIGDEEVRVTEDHSIIVVDDEDLVVSIKPADYKTTSCLVYLGAGIEYYSGEETNIEIKDLGIREEFVYDLETENNNHNFFVNNILVHNSIFVTYGKKEKEIDSKANYDERIDMIDGLNNTIVQPMIDEYFDKLAVMFNCVGNKIKMDAELIADKSTFLAPKKYVMRKLLDGHKRIDPAKNVFKVRGVEIVRTTTPVFFRQRLQEAIIYFFNKTNYELIDFVEETKKSYFKLAFEEMSNPSGVNNMDKYQLGQKGIPLHVYGSLVYNRFVTDNKLEDRYQLITDKAKIKYAYIKTPNRLNAHVIAVPNNIMPAELREIIVLDYEHQFEKNFLNPIRRFLKTFNWEENKSYSWDDIF